MIIRLSHNMQRYFRFRESVAVHHTSYADRLLGKSNNQYHLQELLVEGNGSMCLLSIHIKNHLPVVNQGLQN